MVLANLLARAGLRRASCIVLAAILLVAAGLRLFDLGRLSFWYDESTTMVAAREPDPGLAVATFCHLDSTHAVLHPLLVYYWERAFGTSEASARLPSALFGILTVLAVRRVTRRLYDEPTALWAAWLVAVSPLIVQQSREVRSYSWLLLMTCVAWDQLLALRDEVRFARVAGYLACLLAMFYLSALGSFAITGLGAGYLWNWRSFRLRPGPWALIHLAFVLGALPWLPRYVGHAPEFTWTSPTPVTSVTWLLWYVGGNRLTLPLFLALAAYGVVTIRRGGAAGRPTEHPTGPEPRGLAVESAFAASILLCWLVVPSALFIAYTLKVPLFGPARYLICSAPAFLILVARGMAKLPRALAVAAFLGHLALAAPMIRSIVFAPDVHPDWRDGVATILRAEPRPVVISLIPDTIRMVPIGYYLGDAGTLLTPDGFVARFSSAPLPETVWSIQEALPGRDPIPPISAAFAGDYVAEREWSFPGARLVLSRRHKP